ncbi:MAG: carbonic anhydrase [Myxococcota bacterium]
MQKLVQGIHRFQSQVFAEQRLLFERLANGQQPEVLFITCSDSRIVPNLITQTDPGDLFIIRNAGNIIPPYSPDAGGEQASIEFAVEALGVKHVVVCGHSRCGAMKALLHPAGTERFPSVTHWLTHAEATRRIMQDHYQHLDGDRLTTATAEENVLVQLENLQTHAAVRSAMRAKKLTLHGWVYKIETGQVFHYEAGSGQFLPLSSERTATPEAHAPL